MRAGGGRHQGPCALTHPGPLPNPVPPRPLPRDHSRPPSPRPRPQPPQSHPVGAKKTSSHSPSIPGSLQEGGAQAVSRAGGGACLLSAPEAPPPDQPDQSRAPHLRGGTAPPSPASGASPPLRVRCGSGSCVRLAAASLAGRSAVASGHRHPRPPTLDPAGRPRRGGGGSGGGALAPCPCGAAAAPWPGISGDFPRGEREDAGVGDGRGAGRAGSAALFSPRLPLYSQPRSPAARATVTGSTRRPAPCKVSGEGREPPPSRFFLFLYETPNKLSYWVRVVGTTFSGCDLAPAARTLPCGRGTWRSGLGGQDG